MSAEPRAQAVPAPADVSWTLESGVATITLDRPPVNAISVATWRTLQVVLDDIRASADCRVVVLRSALGVFSAGADMKEPTPSPAGNAARQQLAREVLDAILRFPVPVICAVGGAALGAGCALACVCDIRLASEQASFGLPEINVARAGGGRHLMRVLPQDAVRHAYFTGRPIAAREAWRLGMVREIFEDGAALDEAASTLAVEIAAKNPTTVRMVKQALDLVEEMPIRSGYEVEQQFTLRLGLLGETAQASAAFRDIRTPPRSEG